MDQRTIQILFALLRSAISGTQLTQKEQDDYSPDMLGELIKVSIRHDVVHLLVLGLKQNKLIPKEQGDIEKYIYKAVARHERTNYEYENLCAALEKGQIPFIPLKGSILRHYYPEAWMRTSCDIDVLVHNEDLNKAISYLSDNYGYVEKERATHDVSLFSPAGIHVELHFDLVEEGRAKNAIGVLQSVWENVTLRENSEYLYEMSDAYFYFYHIAHMAKHFETGGCGIRPFVDLYILDGLKNKDLALRDKMLSDGGLLRFAEVCRKLSRIWLCGEEIDELSLQLQEFLFHGGLYGSFDNRVMLQQKKKGGRFGYLMSRVFAPYSRLKRYYPVLEKYPILTPVMQVRRWFMLLRSDVFTMAKKELETNSNVDRKKAEQMNVFLDDIGL